MLRSSDNSRADAVASGQPCAERPAWSPAAAAGLAAVAGLAAALFYFHLGTYGLWEPDEARYAEIAREMLATRNFLVPHLNYVPYIEKPPLLYWMTALAMRLFGVNEFAARFVNAGAALLGVAATSLFAARTFDPRRGMVAGAVLATCILYAMMAQVLTTDMLLTATITVAFYALYLHWREGGRWCWIAYAAMGLAALTKGPVGVAIPCTAMLIFLWREGGLRGSLRRFHLLPGLALAAAISLPWFIAITIREPGFFDFYFIGEHFRRFFDSDYSHDQPIYYYLPFVVGGLMPWTLAVPLIRWRRLAPSSARRFCLIASGFVLVLFSLSSAKLVPYILPAFPPLAIVVADRLVGAIENGDARRLAALGPLLGVTGGVALLVALHAADFRTPYPAMVKPAIMIAGLIMMGGGLLCFVAFWKRRGALGLGLFVATAAGLLIVISYGRLMAEPLRSYAVLARTIERLEPEARLVCYPRYMQALPFYTRRRVILVGGRTELTFGSNHDPDAAQYFFIKRADLVRLWNDPRPTVFVIDRFVAAQLRSILGPFRVIASDRKKLAIMRPADAAAPAPHLSPEDGRR